MGSNPTLTAILSITYGLIARTLIVALFADLLTACEHHLWGVSHYGALLLLDRSAQG